MPDLLDISGVSADLTAYAHDQKFHLFSQLLTPGVNDAGTTTSTKVGPVSAYAETYVTNDRVILSESFVNSTLQRGGTDTFSPTPNAFGFKTRFASVSPVKIDLLMKKTTILGWYKSYFGMVKGGKYDPSTFPFEEYMLQKVVEGAQSDLRDALWNAIDTVGGTTTLDLFDGWKKQLNDLILAGDIPAGNITVNGGITVANALDEMEKLVETIPDQYLYHPDLVCISAGSFVRTYNKSFAKTYTAAPYNGTYEQNKILGTDIEMIIEPKLNGYKFPIVTLRKNLGYLYDDESNQTSLEIDYQKRDRSIAFVADFQAGVGVAIPELIWSMK